MQSKWLSRLTIALLLVILGLPLNAQSDRGSITGLVTDSSAAAIPRVQVMAVNVGSNASREATTSETGKYVFPELPPGVYAVSVKHTGFKTYRQDGITVGVGQTLTLDIALQLGDVAETIEVHADAIMLKTENAEIATSVTPEKLSAIPLNFSGAMRNPMTFLKLVPGASVSRDQSWPVTSQNGLQSFTEEIRLDGASGTNPTPGVFNEVHPSVDALQEMEVQTSSFAPEYGNAGGAIMNMTMRSGTNDLHGTAYEFLRNEFFNAKNKELQPGDPKTKQRKHEFGGTAGGPLVIPKVYDGHNRTFWFTSYDQFYMRDLQRGYFSVPREEWRRGDLSSLLLPNVLGTDVLGRPIREGQIYDPATTRTEVVGGNSYVVRDPFLNNQLPLRSDVAKRILSFVPAATTAGVDVNNLMGVTGTPFRDQITWSLKMDHELSPKSRLSGMFNYHYTHKINGATPFGMADPARDQTITSKIVRITHDYSFGASSLNHLSIGLLRYQNPDGVPDRGFDPDKELSLRGTLIKGWFPAVTYGNGLTSIGTQQLKHLYHTVPTITDSFSKVVGSHTLKFGAEYRKAMANFFGGNGAYGGLTFAAAQTALPYLSGTGDYALTGQAFASFLLGQAGTGSYLNSPVHMSYRYSDYAFFAQDDFKVTPRLTINYGLRYDLHRPLTEKYGRISSFVADISNPGAGNRSGALGFLGSGPGRTGRDSWLDCDWRGIGPRIGVAYRLTEKLALRGGFGVVYGRLEANTFDPIQSVGSGSVTTSYPSIDPATQSLFSLDSGFPVVDKVPPVLDPTLMNNQGPNAFLRESGRLPRIYTWSFAVQRQITPDLTVEAAYVGNRGTRLISANFVNLNQNDFSVLSMGDKLLQKINSEADAAALGVAYPYPGFQGTVAQALRPYPQFKGIGDPQATVGESNYNSLQVQATKRLSRGLDFLVAYTLSKNITTVDEAFGWAAPGSIDAKKLSLERGLATAGNSPGDRTHNLAAAFGYELPLENRVTNRAAKHVVGGWRVSGVVQYASGGALGMGYPNNLSNTIFNNAGRYNAVAGRSRTISVGSPWPGVNWMLDPAAFTAPGGYTVGNAARTYGDIRGFPDLNEDVALSKFLRFSENHRLEIRMEAFNLLNRSIWNNPSTSITQTPRIQGGRAIGYGSFWGRANTERQMQAHIRFTF